MKITTILIFLALPLSAAVNYSYDAAGRLALVDYGNGTTIAYTYDNAGNLLSRTVTTAPPSQSAEAKPQTARSKDSREGSKKETPPAR